jgi:hypothetical protein
MIVRTSFLWDLVIDFVARTYTEITPSPFSIFPAFTQLKAEPHYNQLPTNHNFQPPYDYINYSTIILTTLP